MFRAQSYGCPVQGTFPWWESGATVDPNGQCAKQKHQRPTSALVSWQVKVCRGQVGGDHREFRGAREQQILSPFSQAAPFLVSYVLQQNGWHLSKDTYRQLGCLLLVLLLAIAPPAIECSTHSLSRTALTPIVGDRVWAVRIVIWVLAVCWMQHTFMTFTGHLLHSVQNATESVALCPNMRRHTCVHRESESEHELYLEQEEQLSLFVPAWRLFHLLCIFCLKKNYYESF